MNEKSFVIAYDLDTTISDEVRGKPVSKVYEELESAIKEYGTWAHLQLSCWAIQSTDTAAIIRDKLQKILHEQDRLLVLQSANVAAWHNLICSNKWMKENI